MIIEGKGHEPPAPVFVEILPATLKFVRIQADRREYYRRYGKRADAWGRGLGNSARPNERDSCSPILVGMMGEEVVAAYLTRHGLPTRPDYKAHENGDGERDLVANGVVIQVKTRRSVGGTSLIRRTDARQQILLLSAQAYVFVQWSEEVPLEAALLGWAKPDWLLRFARMEPSPVADHDNLVIGDWVLLPMVSLVDGLKARSR